MNIHHNNLEKYFGIFTIGTYSENSKKFSIEKTTTDLGTRIGKLILFVLGNVVSLILYIVLLTIRANLEKNISTLDKESREKEYWSAVKAASKDEHAARLLGIEALPYFNIQSGENVNQMFPEHRAWHEAYTENKNAYTDLTELSNTIGSYTAMVNTTLEEAEYIYSPLNIHLDSIPQGRHAYSLDFAIFKMFETLKACTKAVDSFEKCSRTPSYPTPYYCARSYLGAARYYNDMATKCKNLLETLINLRPQKQL